jgi:hypothetical protein
MNILDEDTLIDDYVIKEIEIKNKKMNIEYLNNKIVRIYINLLKDKKDEKMKEIMKIATIKEYDIDDEIEESINKIIKSRHGIDLKELFLFTTKMRTYIMKMIRIQEDEFKTSIKNIHDKTKQCVICYDETIKNKYKTYCDHIYCMECYEQLLKTGDCCAICRRKIGSVCLSCLYKNKENCDEESNAEETEVEESDEEIVE